MEGRELRIIAKRDLYTGEYRAEYERRATLRCGGDTCQIWAGTTAHPSFVAPDARTCLELAIEDVGERHVF